MSNSKALYEQYVAKMQQIADINYANAVLQWDQETYMPAKSAAARARQMATLSELAHKSSTDEHLGKLLQELLGKNDLTAIEQKNVQLSWEDYTKQQKYTGAFVRTMSEAVSASFNAWMDARKANSFAVFEPALTKLVELKKQEAELLGYEKHAYNALLNEYEKGISVDFLDNIFTSIEKPLADLLMKADALGPIDDSFLQNHYARQKQWEWGLYLIKELGFDFEAGRQDISEHPFTTNFSATDVRLTTRIDIKDFSNMTWSCIHEAGHGLYEQGLPEKQYGLPCGTYTSLSIHESQSRLWENNVGRSLAFWKYYFPKLDHYFPEQLKNVSAIDFYKAINKIQPSFIRTEADELTYHAHVQIRYQLEKEIISGNCSIKNIPSIWNEQYKQFLGVIVPDDKKGCLQDVHWSHGSFGYFPTYSLGSFYAAQFYTTAAKEIKGLETQLQNGNTTELLGWLRKNIHQYGRMYTSDELCTKITGESLNTSYFIKYLRAKIDSLK